MSQAASLEPTAIAGVTRGLADTDEVIPDDVEPIHVHAVLKRLGARVRQLGGPAHQHLHREVPALSVAGRDVLGIGRAFYATLHATPACRRAVLGMTCLCGFDEVAATRLAHIPTGPRTGTEKSAN